MKLFIYLLISFSFIFVDQARASDFYIPIEVFFSQVTDQNNSIYFEIIKGLPAAFVALVIGLIAAYVALRQYCLAKAKFKLDLFERRLKIFNALEAFLSTIQKPVLSFADLNSFHYEMSESSFLFGTDIQGYLEMVGKKAAQLHAISLRCQANGNAINFSDIDSHTELSEWVITQRLGGAREMFRKYLSFDTWH